MGPKQCHMKSRQLPLRRGNSVMAITYLSDMIWHVARESWHVGNQLHSCRHKKSVHLDDGNLKLNLRHDSAEAASPIPIDALSPRTHAELQQVVRPNLGADGHGQRETCMARGGGAWRSSITRLSEHTQTCMHAFSSGRVQK